MNLTHPAKLKVTAFFEFSIRNGARQNNKRVPYDPHDIKSKDVCSKGI